MVDWHFHPTFVAPFYLQLMGANLVNGALLGDDERGRLLAEFRLAAGAVTDSQLREMLASGWRPALVATWLIAYLRKHAFRGEIEGMLLRRPAHAQHLCICLSQFGGESATRALLAYLQGCAARTLQTNPMDEAITPEWALCSVEHIASTEDTSYAASLWKAFLETQRQAMDETPWMRRHAESCLMSWERRLAGARRAHARVMALFENELKA